MAMQDWRGPESWLAEAANERLVAQNHRREAAMYYERHQALQAAGAPREQLRALSISRMHAIQQAAFIERKLRNIA